ncbi:MAG TPA: YjbE family putative metal transport protein [Roseiarcus sp.]|jgi:YjbE family integral membrane protein
MDLGDGSNWLFVPLQILVVDLLLGADNALVIALACRSLAPEDRRRAVTIGVAGAIVFRLVMTVVASSLLAIPLVKIVGALALTVIAMNISSGDGLNAPAPIRRRDAAPDHWSTAAVIIVADAAMSLDNVVALAAIARGSFWLLAIGVALSLPILGFGGMLLIELLRRAPGLVAFGAALLGWIAGGMAISDPMVAPWANANAPGLVAITPALVAAFVWLNGLFGVKKAAPITALEPPARPAPFALESTIPPPPLPSTLPSPKPRAGARTEDRVMIFGVLVLAIVAGAFLVFLAYVDSHVTRGGPGVGADASSQAGAYRP